MRFRSDLRPVSETEFVSDNGFARLSFSSIEHTQAETVELNWRGSERTAERAPKGLELPMEMARSGRIDAGFRAFLDNKEENSRLYPPMETSLNNLAAAV